MIMKWRGYTIPVLNIQYIQRLDPGWTRVHFKPSASDTEDSVDLRGDKEELDLFEYDFKRKIRALSTPEQIYH